MAEVPSLRDLMLYTVYTRDNCPDLVEGFFVPTLSRAVRYDRATYTFSPEALIVAAAGFAGLINNGGRMRLICHHQLPKDVVQAIVDGQRAAEDAVIESLGYQGLVKIDPNDLRGIHHLKLLTWLVKEGRLEIKVAIPRLEGGIFHQKIGIFTDGHGDSVAFNGSLNESRLGWLLNDESMAVFNSWDSQAYLGQIAELFDRLWENRSDSSLVIPIPEALRKNLIDFAPAELPAIKENDGPYQVERAKRNVLRDELWATISHAVASDPQTTIETTASELWPHQLSFWRRYGRDADTPPRVLIADEVGLGKTIQAGAVLKTLINREQADRVLILTPAVARWQWQEELRHKFNIEAPVLDRRGGQLQLVGSDGRRRAAGSAPWSHAQQLILSYDWLRRNANQFFADNLEYDMVVFDEAHHARYLDVNNPRQRRENSYLRMLKSLAERTRGLMLLTATPMQIDPSELWALIRTLHENGQWNEAEFRRFYDVNAAPTLEEWDAARQLYTREGLPGSVEQIAELARIRMSEAREHLNYIQMPASSGVVLRRDMTPDRIQESMRLMRRSSSVKRSVSRHTRNLLRQYVAENRLSQPVPLRDVQSVAVEMNEDERGLYDDIRDLVRECYQGRANVNRQALGFVMTHFRLRLGSSLYAFQRSLEDLNERALIGHSYEIQWDDLPVGDEDNYSDLDPETAIPGPELTSNGQRMLTDLLDRCRAQASPDSKFDGLLTEIARLRSKGYGKVMVFSQFRDTQVWLREQLGKENGDFLLAGLSGSEDWIYQPSDQAFVPRAREAVVRKFRERPEGILLCTETAAESLNFQFCSAIINYDIPWNPMRLEQRIGRIDRIGQEKPVIRIVHLFYRDTVEYDAYTAMEERIEEFQENVGTLQPILAANLETIIRESVMDDRPLGSAGQAVRSLTPSIGFDLDDLAAASADEQDPAPLLYRNDLTYILNHPEWLPDGYHSEPRGDNHWRVSTPSGNQYTVTTDRRAHDYSAGTVEFFGPGSPAFPTIHAGTLSAEEDNPRPGRGISEILRYSVLDSHHP